MLSLLLMYIIRYRNQNWRTLVNCEMKIVKWVLKLFLIDTHWLGMVMDWSCLLQPDWMSEIYLHEISSQMSILWMPSHSTRANKSLATKNLPNLKVKAISHRKLFLEGNQKIIIKAYWSLPHLKVLICIPPACVLRVTMSTVHHPAIITSNQVLSQRWAINQSHPSHLWHDTWPVDIRGVSQLLLETICLKQWTNYHLNVSKDLLFICWKFMTSN